MLKLPLKQLFWKGIRYRNLRKALVGFALLLAIQLRYSRRARTYAIRAVAVLGFGVTFVGFLVTLVLFYIKLKMHNKHMATLQEQQQEQRPAVQQNTAETQ